MFACPEVGNSQRILLLEDKSASNQPCESSNASPNRCRQELWVSLWCYERGLVLWSRKILLEHVCQAVGCPGRHSKCQVRDGVDFPSVREETGYSLWFVQQLIKVVGCCPGGQAINVSRCGCWLLPGRPSYQRQQMQCCNPSWHAGSRSRQHTGWCVETSGWL